jgi:4-amino-4-deoxy-L-arabinose transferase-like glycosyltransferase
MNRRFQRAVLLAIAGLLLVRLPVLSTREFDADEFEHAHAAWSWFGGLVPYKDFFEHHTPWYYYALRPFFNCFDVAASFDSATHFLLFVRVISLGLAALSLWLVYRLGRDWEAPNVGLLAALMLAAQPIFLQKSIEIRPDMLALPFCLAGLLWLLRGLATERLPWFLAAGLAIGGALMSTQKVLFVLPGTMAGLGLWALSARLRVRVLHVASFLAAVAVPAAVTWAAFAARGAGGEFIANNFLLNAGWRHTGTGELAKLLWTSGPVLALALWGLRQTWVHLRRADSGDRPHGDLLLACTMVGLFAGVAVIPVAYRQYYLLPLPIACLLAARSALALAERARRWQLVVAVVVMAALPLNTLRESFVERNDRQLARLRHVYETTAPTDVVLDGWAGTGVFRPHALHHFFLHEEIVAMLPRARLETYLDALEAGAIRPKLIALDGNLVSLGPRFLTFVKQRYATTDGFFYLRRD